MHSYGPDFFRFLASFAVVSAERVVPVVRAALPVGSVVDFGCGQGAWLSVWAKSGAAIQGVDGDYVDRSGLLIPPESFRVANLAEPIDFGQRFSLAQSLEVAEHLPPAWAEQHIAALVLHAPAILFSAAVPGQGGEHHVNEKPLEYWRSLFRRQGYLPVDCIRPAIRRDRAVQKWYRYNTILYIQEDLLDRLAPEARKLLVPDGVPLRNEWPLMERLHQAILRPLPVPVIDSLARLAARHTRWRADRS